MKLRVEQALFGEVEGGHGLRASSLDKQQVRMLAPRLDLPKDVPLGVSWEPYLSGFPFGERYVIARTLLDSNASRGQLVLAHALICDRDEISRAVNISPLLAALMTGPDDVFNANALSVDLDTEIPAPTEDMSALAAALVQDRSLPVVRLGVDGFDDLVASLWARLPPGIRQNFYFRMSFGPSDIEKPASPALVYSPAKVGTWDGAVIISSSSRAGDLSRPAKLLCGDSAGDAILHFAETIGASVKSFADLSWLDRILGWVSNESASFDDLLNAMRRIDGLSPDPSKGVEAKEALVARLADRISIATLPDILKLRNVTRQGIPDLGKLWAAVEDWVASNKFTPEGDSAFLALLANTNDPKKAVADWSRSVIAGMERSGGGDGSSIFAAFWRWASLDAASFERAAKCFPITQKTQQRLTKSAPRHLSEHIVEKVKAFARGRDWYELHGAAVSGILDGQDAVRAQMEIDPELSDADGLRAALRGTKGQALLDCAMALRLPPLTREAGEAAAASPALLTERLVHDETGRAIWIRALEVDAGAWRGSIDPQATMRSVVNGMLDAGLASDGLVDTLSRTSLADLCNFERRAEVWARAESALATRLLAATAESWLQQVVVDQQKPFDPDPALESAILRSAGFEASLRALSSKLDEFVSIVQALPGLDEARFCGFLDGLLASRPWPYHGAQAVGRLLLERNWQSAADALADTAANQGADLMPALRICATLVDAWKRVKLRIATLTTDERWEMFEDTVADLYPGGPDEQQVWERAGGKNADLRAYGNGRDRWREALRKVRLGLSVREKKILNVIAEDYPRNDKIAYLRDEGLSGSWWW